MSLLGWKVRSGADRPDGGDERPRPRPCPAPPPRLTALARFEFCVRLQLVDPVLFLESGRKRGRNVGLPPPGPLGFTGASRDLWSLGSTGRQVRVEWLDRSGPPRLPFGWQVRKKITLEARSGSRSKARSGSRPGCCSAAQTSWSQMRSGTSGQTEAGEASDSLEVACGSSSSGKRDCCGATGSIGGNGTGLGSPGTTKPSPNRRGGGSERSRRPRIDWSGRSRSRPRSLSRSRSRGGRPLSRDRSSTRAGPGARSRRRSSEEIVGIRSRRTTAIVTFPASLPIPSRLTLPLRLPFTHAQIRLVLSRQPYARSTEARCRRRAESRCGRPRNRRTQPG